MPWTIKDYPQSWKNFEELKRKKAIDTGNAMLKDGYKESRAIPIATKQAEEWYEQASQTELKELRNKQVTQHSKDQDAEPELNDRDVHVYFEDDQWKVKTGGAKKPSNTFEKKEDAIERARHITNNRGTKIVTHKKQS